MIHKHRFFYPTLLAALLASAALVSLRAQDPGGAPPRRHGPPPSPLFDALDTNHDGIISADEIANAPAALKALLKNGATQLTRDDVRPPRPARDDQARGGRPHDDQARDDRAQDDQARPHPQDADRADHPPRPEADDAGPAAADGGHDQARPGDDAAHRRHGPPPSPLFDALDTNHDGIISADEIANAPAALKKLDKSGTGQIRRGDLMKGPPHDRE